MLLLRKRMDAGAITEFGDLCLEYATVDPNRTPPPDEHKQVDGCGDLEAYELSLGPVGISRTVILERGRLGLAN